MDLGKLVPLAFKLLGQADKIKGLIQKTDPTIAELRKVWPEAAPLIRDIIARVKLLHAIMEPTLHEGMKAWPQIEPTAKDLVNQIWPELVAQWAKPHESTLPVFSVRWMQENLNTLGANPRVKVDGDMGPDTAEAIKKFQARVGIQVDGWMGPETLTAMLRALAAKQ